jgi:hypothetical protein
MESQKLAIVPHRAHHPLNQARSMTHSSSGLASTTRVLTRHHLRSRKLSIFTLNTAIDSRFGVLIASRSQTQVTCPRSSFVASSH